MRWAAVVLVAAGGAELAWGPALAFNPDPRPAPPGVQGVCSTDPSFRDPSIEPTEFCYDDGLGCDFGSGASCLARPSTVQPGIAVRGTLTLITDEDVTGWDAGADTSADRPARARLTVLLQYQRAGALRTFSETYDLSGEGDGCIFKAPEDPPLPLLCIPNSRGFYQWDHPASEFAVTGPNIQWTSPGAGLRDAVLRDLLGGAPAPGQLPFIEIVDPVPGAAVSHTADPLASVGVFKVTIRVTR
jgi:hypothetical protein